MVILWLWAQRDLEEYLSISEHMEFDISLLSIHNIKFLSAKEEPPRPLIL